jgi:hypothetical protein
LALPQVATSDFIFGLHIYYNNAMDEISGDKIANAVLEQFDTLPANVKPLNRGGGVKEWVPLSGIVAQSPLVKSEGKKK